MSAGATAALRVKHVKSPEERQADLEVTMEKLQAGLQALRTSDGWQSWLAFAARMPSYSLNNQLLIITQQPSASAVAGYSTWRSLGRQVRRGETGIRILAPVTRVITDHADAVDTEKPTTSEDGVREKQQRGLAGFRVVSVFDVAQTEGEALPEPQRPTLLEGQSPEGLWEALSSQVHSSGFTVSRASSSAEIGGANGVTDFLARTVQVRADVSDAQATKTLAHELGHVMLHDPSIDPLWRMPCRAIKEVEAESVAYLVAAHAGLDTADYTFGYVAGWANGRSDSEMATAASRVMTTARNVIDQLAQSRAIVGADVLAPTSNIGQVTSSQLAPVTHRAPGLTL